MPTDTRPTRPQAPHATPPHVDVVTLAASRPAGWTVDEWTHLLAALTRRRFLVGAAGMLALGALAACGDDDADADATPTVATRTVSTAFGDVVVPAAPQRVVALLFAEGVLLDIGLIPVGVQSVDPAALLPEQLTTLEAVQRVGVGETDELDLEQIAALQPDLILGAHLAGSELPFDALSAIAPTVIFNLASAAELREQTLVLADAVGRRTEAERWRTDYQSRVAEITAAHATAIANTHWSLIDSFGDEWAAYAPYSWAGSILTDLGITFGQAGANVSEGSGEFYSMEQINLLADNDVILYYAENDSTIYDTTQELVTLLQETPGALKPDAQLHPLRYFFADRYRTALEVLDQVETILAGLA